MRTCASTSRSGARSSIHAGFTLIEVLVVVAIIALLISILLPSLNAARNQAKLVVCATNLKQVSLFMSEYQTEFNGRVPIMFNDAASFVSSYKAKAKMCWMSLALGRYSASTRKLGIRTYDGVTYDFDPEKVWTIETRNAYEAHIMPAVYACPFQRDKGRRQPDDPYDQGFYRIYLKRGSFDCVQTWMWEYVIKGQLPPNGIPWQPTPGNPAVGVPKYTAFSWNCVKSTDSVNLTFKSDGARVETVSNAVLPSADAAKQRYRQWTSADVRRLRSGSFGTSTVAYCAQGENILGNQSNGRIGWANPGSHPNGGVGGTNTIFADTHVEWVPGRQIGWP